MQNLISLGIRGLYFKVGYFGNSVKFKWYTFNTNGNIVILVLHRICENLEWLLHFRKLKLHSIVELFGCM